MRTIHYHDGDADFPHRAGASDEGFYIYPNHQMVDEPNGPYDTLTEAVDNGGHIHSIAMMVDSGFLPDSAKDEALTLLTKRSFDLTNVVTDMLSACADLLSASADTYDARDAMWNRDPGSITDDALAAIGIETREEFDKEV